VKQAVLTVAIFAQSALGWQEPPKVGEWKNYTDMKNVTAVAVSGETVWAATSGGVFLREFAAATMKTYTNSEGLSTNDATAITTDGAGTVWIGFRDGSVDVLSAGTSFFRTIGDIKESNRVQKRIRKFLIEGDSLFIATDFGLSVYRLSRSEFGDTYANFGFAGQSGVNDLLVWNNELWVATDLGLARAPRFATNLSAPTSWTRYQSAEGLPGPVTNSLIVFDDTLLVGTSGGAAYFDGTVFQPLASLGGRQNVRIVPGSGEFFTVSNLAGGITLQRSADVVGAAAVVAIENGVTATDFAVSLSGIPWIATNSRGITTWNGTAWISTSPNGPQSNLFSSLVVDRTGVLWCASGISGQGRGFYRFDPRLPDSTKWKNYSLADFPVMGSNDYYKAGIGAAGTVWISSWGEGVVEVVGDTIRRKLDAGSVPSLASSVPSGPPFEVVGSVAEDPNGRPWFVNRTASNGNYLAQLTNDSTFVYYTNIVSPGQGLFTAMVIDGNGTKWLANAEPFNKPASGLFYFNEDNRVSGTTSTGGWGLMTTADGLPNNTVLSLAVDARGNVCVGTDLGLLIISEPLFPKQRKFTSFPLREQTIQAIAVDAVDNKWVGTKEGVFVMNTDATQILQQYSVSNTGGRLVDNDVRSLAIDQRQGIVYVGTEKGLSSLAIAPVAVSRSLTDLGIGPNPFVIPSERQMEIRNLASETVIKILSVDGSLVSQFSAQGGGRAFWNGRDREGNLVASGVYFVIAFVESGDEVAAGKVAVIRK